MRKLISIISIILLTCANVFSQPENILSVGGGITKYTTNHPAKLKENVQLIYLHKLSKRFYFGTNLSYASTTVANQLATTTIYATRGFKFYSVGNIVNYYPFAYHSWTPFLSVSANIAYVVNIKKKFDYNTIKIKRRGTSPCVSIGGGLIKRINERLSIGVAVYENFYFISSGIIGPSGFPAAGGAIIGSMKSAVVDNKVEKTSVVVNIYINFKIKDEKK